MEEIKLLLPIFNGVSSLSLVDAIDTWKKTLTKAGIHELLWGNIILSRVEDPALSRLPSSVKQNRKFGDICSSLEENYGGILKTCLNIMRSHEAADKIPDPYITSDDICGKILREHSEIIKNTERFLFLSKGEDAASNLMTGSNLMTLLDILPTRVRMEEDILEVAEQMQRRSTSNKPRLNNG